MWNIFVYTMVLLSPTMSQTPNTYQITEVVDDIPDNRTRAPIDPTYGIRVPLNFGNNTVISSENTEQNTPTSIPPSSKPGSYEITENPNENSPQKNKGTKNNTNKEKSNVKKNSFSILHIKGEYENGNKVTNNEAGFKGFLNGLRSYIYSMKKGLVDGLYNWYHKDEAQKEIDKFYRSFKKDFESDDGDESSGSGDDNVWNWIQRDEVKKEIDDFYKTFNEDSDEDSKNDGEHDYSDDLKFDHHHDYYDHDDYHPRKVNNRQHRKFSDC